MNRGKTAPIWQVVLLTGAVQSAIGIVWMVVGVIAQTLEWIGAGGAVLVLGVLTAAAGVVLSWRRA